MRRSGTDKPQKVGGVWPINKGTKPSQGAKTSGMVLKPEDLDGTGTLVSTKTIDGKEYLEVKAEFTAKNIQFPMPPGMATDDAHLEAKFSGLFPADGGKAKIFQTMDMNMEIKAKGKCPGQCHEHPRDRSYACRAAEKTPIAG